MGQTSLAKLRIAGLKLMTSQNGTQQIKLNTEKQKSTLILQYFHTLAAEMEEYHSFAVVSHSPSVPEVCLPSALVLEVSLSL
jgi:hypothetical protein